MTHQFPSAVQPYRMHYISREKVGNPLLRHAGVLVETVFSVFAVERQAGIGPRAVAPAVFAQGRPVRVEATVAGTHAVRAAWSRLNEAVAEPGYDPINNNCEHLARHAISGERRSYQVEILAVIAGVVLLILLCRGE